MDYVMQKCVYLWIIGIIADLAFVLLIKQNWHDASRWAENDSAALYQTGKRKYCEYLITYQHRLIYNMIYHKRHFAMRKDAYQV